MVCDGSSHQGTITLGHSYTNSLDAASERLFLSIVTQKGLMAYGADCSNAFVEATPPKFPLYMLLDEAFWDCWENHLKREPIPDNCTVVQVHHAIQGHPESPRLWEKLIDSILCNIKLQPTKQKPCLYMGILNGYYTLFLQKMDDFAIAMENDNCYVYCPKH